MTGGVTVNGDRWELHGDVIILYSRRPGIVLGVFPASDFGINTDQEEQS